MQGVANTTSVVQARGSIDTFGETLQRHSFGTNIFWQQGVLHRLPGFYYGDLDLRSLCRAQLHHRPFSIRHLDLLQCHAERQLFLRQPLCPSQGKFPRCGNTGHIVAGRCIVGRVSGTGDLSSRDGHQLFFTTVTRIPNFRKVLAVKL